MKKIISSLVALAICTASLTACTAGNSSDLDSFEVNDQSTYISTEESLPQTVLQIELETSVPETTTAKTTTKKPETTTAKTTTKKPETTTAKTTTSTPAPTPAPTPDQPSSVSGYASEVLRLVNIERQKEGLSALKTNSEINRLAQIRSNEIISEFDHQRPDGRDWISVLTDNGYSYRAAGENIAWGQSSPAEVVKGWMNSPGHRENILYESFGTLGVGVSVSNGTIYWAQLFTN